jgi:hypothetical protein
MRGVEGTRTENVAAFSMAVTAQSPGGAEPPIDAACDAAISDEIRCQLEAGHGGLHRWRSPDGSRSFDWG